nr:MAG TPA: hypothetical protein [Caudoviricetes sp.]
MSNDEIVRRVDALEALGEEPMVWYDDDPIQVQERNDWEHMIDAINAIPCIPFQLHELTEAEICGLHGDNVIVSAPSIEELDKRAVPCLGSHKDVDGKKYVVLDGEEYSQSLFVDGTITLWQVR